MRGVIASFLLLLCSSVPSLIAQVVEWETVHPYPGLPSLSSVAFGEGRFVAAGEGRIFYSEDAGRTWNVGTNGLPFWMTSVLYTNEIFVAVGLGNQIFSSGDGKSWEAHRIDHNAGLLNIIYANGLYVAIGNDALIVTSPDGRNWTIRNSIGESLYLAAYGNGRFLVQGGNASSFLTSTNGFDWSRLAATVPSADPTCVPNPRFGRFCPTFTAFTGLVFANGQFVATPFYPASPGFSGTKVLVSTDGAVWTALPESNPGGGRDGFFGTQARLFHLNGLFFHLAVANISTNLTNWTALPLPYDGPELQGFAFTFGSIAYGDSTYVLVGGLFGWAAITRSTNLINFERVDSPTSRMIEFRGVAVNGNAIVAMDTFSSASITTSTNSGMTFVVNNLPPGSGAISDVKAAQDKFVAVGAGGTVLRSTDGLNWSKRLSNTSRDLASVAFGNGTWVAVGSGGLVLNSADASFFTLGSSGTEISLRSVTYGNGFFVAVGDSGAILRSTNGVNWTIFGTEEALDLRAVTHDNGRFVAVGTNGIVHVSTNALAWTSSRIPNVPLLSDVAGANGLFLAVQGSRLSFQAPVSRTAYLSTNGLSWSPASFLKALHGTDSSDGALWAVGEAAYIARTQIRSDGQPATNMAAAINEQGQFTITFSPPTPGDYTILSSTHLTAGWRPAAILTNISARTSWADTNSPVRARFYTVQPNE
jgi:hypothetical protein